MNLDKPIALRSSGQSVHRLFIFYHYMYPDNVVSAVHMDQLCQGLVERGWHVTAFPSNRGCRDESITYTPRDTWQGVQLRRIWRPRFRQASSLGRVLNAAWMIASWALLALRPSPPDAILIGSDPILSVAVACIWKFLRPRTQIVHWCFDLYPEAAIADGLLAPSGWVTRLLQAILRRAYAACDALIDIGPCMRARLALYSSSARPLKAKPLTIVPWALEEPAVVLPAATEERRHIFADAGLAILYSGNFGRAHTYTEFLALAHHLRGTSTGIAFSVRGNSEPALRAAVQAANPDAAHPATCSMTFVSFAPDHKLLDRLGAPDIHLLSLAPNWSGTVVPSKFFGALAAGRPVLYAGSPHSSVAQWIQTYQVGWLLTADTLEATAADLLAYAADAMRAQRMREHCFATYRQHFSRHTSLDRMDALLRELVQPR